MLHKHIAFNYTLDYTYVLRKRGRQPDFTPLAQIPEAVHYSLPIFTLQVSSFSTAPYHSTLIICNSFPSHVHCISLLSTLSQINLIYGSLGFYHSKTFSKSKVL